MRFDRYFAAAAAVIALGAASASRAQDVQLRIEHAAARVVVIPEARNTVSVSVRHGPSRLPELQVRQEGARIVVDGGLEDGAFGGHDRVHCMGGLHAGRSFAAGRTFDTRAVGVEHLGRVAYADLPVITVHAPMNVRLSAGTAVYGEVGRTDSASLMLAGCGDWTVDDTRGRLALDMAGSGDVQAARAGSVSARLSGSCDLAMRDVAGPADLGLSGSGDVSTGRIDGPLHAQLAGSGDVSVQAVTADVVRASIAASGDVSIHGGHASGLDVNIAGSGNFDFDGTADRLSASVVGSGDVHVAHVTGQVNKTVIGSGEVSFGR